MRHTHTLPATRDEAAMPAMLASLKHMAPRLLLGTQDVEYRNGDESDSISPFSDWTTLLYAEAFCTPVGVGHGDHGKPTAIY